MNDFDLPQFDSRAGAEKGFEVQLLDPKTRLPSGKTITVLGVDSETYQAALRAQQRRMAERVQKARKLVMLTPEEIEANALELMSITTQSWKGFSSKSGAAIPCNIETATGLYSGFPEIREQIDQAQNDRANFLPPSSPNSSPTSNTSSV